MNYPFMRNGYFYSKGTKAGFLRMQRLGIPRPLYSIQDKLAALLRTKYHALIRRLLKDIKKQCAQSNITLDAAPEDDNLESLLKYFDQMKEELAKENEQVVSRINLNTVTNTLEHEWFEEEPESESEYFVKKIDHVS